MKRNSILLRTAGSLYLKIQPFRKRGKQEATKGTGLGLFYSQGMRAHFRRKFKTLESGILGPGARSNTKRPSDE